MMGNYPYIVIAKVFDEHAQTWYNLSPMEMANKDYRRVEELFQQLGYKHYMFEIGRNPQWQPVKSTH